MDNVGEVRDKENSKEQFQCPFATGYVLSVCKRVFKRIISARMVSDLLTKGG